MAGAITEFNGEDGPTGLPLKKRSQLSAREKLRLGYTVGKEDTSAPADKAAWRGDPPTKPE